MSASAAAAGIVIAGMVALTGCQTLDFGLEREGPNEPGGSVVDPAEARLAEAALYAPSALCGVLPKRDRQRRTSGFRKPRRMCRLSCSRR